MVWQGDQRYSQPAISSCQAWQVDACKHDRLCPVVVAWHAISMEAKAPKFLHLELLLHPCMVVLCELVVIVSAKQDIFQPKVPNGL